MNELTQWFASLGVGGVLAGVVFIAYRNDRLADSKRRCDACQNLQRTVDRMNAALADNTKATTGLHEWLKGREGG